ncbi:atherin-like [Motacilla alba alba]|uniref:atherin-like n=1 Tax=Motacilla alba alba TaxID=1094192 RepID=UPI0018D5300B|nr:atherin-like [Motacilla alba alba]
MLFPPTDFNTSNFHMSTKKVKQENLQLARAALAAARSLPPGAQRRARSSILKSRNKTVFQGVGKEVKKESIPCTCPLGQKPHQGENEEGRGRVARSTKPPPERGSAGRESPARGAGLGDAFGGSAEVRGGRRAGLPVRAALAPALPRLRHPGTGLTSGGDGEISQENPGAAAGARTAPAGPGTPQRPVSSPRASPARPTRVPSTSRSRPAPRVHPSPRPSPRVHPAPGPPHACIPLPACPTRVPPVPPARPRVPARPTRASRSLPGRPAPPVPRPEPSCPAPAEPSCPQPRSPPRGLRGAAGAAGGAERCGAARQSRAGPCGAPLPAASPPAPRSALRSPRSP